tara:strand:+ start:404 stop:1294 length:891 start_codon:yes stop_codon:yes gene_type:complete
MSWGETLGAGADAILGNKAPWLRTAGTGFDMLEARGRKDALAVQQDNFRRQEMQLAELETQAFLQDRSNQVALRDRLLQQASDIQGTTEQVNTFLGIPYAPSMRDVAEETAALSESYRGDIMKLAELNASQGKAKQMRRLGGADSNTASEVLEMANVEKYGPLLNKAHQDAKMDAMALVTSRLNLDDLSRKRLQTYHDDGLGGQFEREKQLYSGNQMNLGAGPSGIYRELGSQAGKQYDMAQKDEAMRKSSITGELMTPNENWGIRTPAVEHEDPNKRQAATFNSPFNVLADWFRT